MADRTIIRPARFDEADTIEYRPDVPDNWNVEPRSVHQALDSLALNNVLTFVDANGVTTNNGTPTGSVSDLQTMADGNSYDIVEVSGAPGINVEVDFADVTAIQHVVVSAYYEGNTSHAVRVQLYNYTDTAWDTFDTLHHFATSDFLQMVILVPDDSDYISGGAAIVRLDHTETGTPGHDLYIDYCGLGYVTQAGGGSGGGVGTHTLGDSSVHTDINITALDDKDFLKYDSASGKWVDFPLFSTSNTWSADQVITASTYLRFVDATMSLRSLFGTTLQINGTIIQLNSSTGLTMTGANLNSNWTVNTSNEIRLRDATSRFYSPSTDNVTLECADTLILSGTISTVIGEYGHCDFGEAAGTVYAFRPAGDGDADLGTTARHWLNIFGDRVHVGMADLAAANPPSDANFDSAFGSPATLVEGFVGILWGSSFSKSYICWVQDSDWYYIEGTKAT